MECVNILKALYVPSGYLLQRQCKVWAACGTRYLKTLDLVYQLLVTLYPKNGVCSLFRIYSLVWCLVGFELRDVILNSLSKCPEGWVKIMTRMSAPQSNWPDSAPGSAVYHFVTIDKSVCIRLFIWIMRIMTASIL